MIYLKSSSLSRYILFIYLCVCVYIYYICNIKRFITRHSLMWLWGLTKQALNLYGSQSGREDHGQTQTHWRGLGLLPVSSQERSIMSRPELCRHSQKLFSTGGISFSSQRNLSPACFWPSDRFSQVMKIIQDNLFYLKSTD